MTELTIESIKLPKDVDIKALLEIFTATFEQLSQDKDYQQGIQNTVPGVGDMYGVRVPLLREFAKQLHKAYRGQHQALKTLARDSWEVGTREHRLVALYLLEKAKMPHDDRWALGLAFLPAVDNWETCDVMCMSLPGIAICQDPGYMDAIEAWIEEENFWVRRAALVTTTRLRNAKFGEDLKVELDRRSLAMCQALLYDNEKYIRKAVDWAIREVLRRNYDMGRAWMMERAQESLGQPALSTLKLAAKKLGEGDYEVFIREAEKAK